MISFNRFQVFTVFIFCIVSFVFVGMSAANENINEDLNGHLLTAAYEGDISHVKALIKQGADINAQDDRGYTALMHASWEGHFEIAKYLTENNADMTLEGGEYGGATAFWLAIGGAKHGDPRGLTKIVKNFVEKKGADINALRRGTTALMRASWDGNIELVKYLVENGADIHAFSGAHKGEGYYPPDVIAWTPLIMALVQDNPEVATYLMEKGADINATDGTGKTALIIISFSYSNVELIKYLVENGADIHVKDKNGNTALMVAKSRNHKDTVEYLKKHGAK